MTYLQPVLSILIILIAIGLLRSTVPRWRRIGIGAVAGLFLFSWTPFAALTSLTLEWRYPVETPPPQEVGAIVVLAGGTYPPDPSQREAAPTLDTYVRCQYAAWLHRNWRAVPVFASGGRSPEQVLLSGVMRRVLEGEGVPPGQVFTEDRSTSTYTNATQTAAVLKDRGIRKIALVTEAFHMWRAELCFRKQGIQVVPAPCAFRGRVFRPKWGDFIPGPKGMGWNGDVLHEWIGLPWYRISGKI
jgi:uncharacterized SAM-binding protein YcdF (DUF218 family)